MYIWVQGRDMGSLVFSVYFFIVCESEELDFCGYLWFMDKRKKVEEEMKGRELRMLEIIFNFFSFIKLEC